MFKFYLNELIKQKEIKDHKIISINQLSNEIGVSRPILSRMSNSHLYPGLTVTTDTIQKILSYFQCKQVTELIEYIPD